MAAFKLSGVCVRSFFLVIVGAHVLYSKGKYLVCCEQVGNRIFMSINVVC